MSQKYSFFDPIARETFRKEHKIEPYRFKQADDAIFKQAVIDFQEMTVLSKEMRDLFESYFEIVSLRMIELVEDDETSKFLFETYDGQVLESVLMYHFHTKREDMTFNNTLQVDEAGSDE